jgi:hypothetical protein
MLAQNKDSGWLSPLFLACPLRQWHFNFPSPREKECTSIHSFISKYSPGLKLSPSDLLRNLMISVPFLNKNKNNWLLITPSSLFNNNYYLGEIR